MKKDFCREVLAAALEEINNVADGASADTLRDVLGEIRYAIKLVLPHLQKVERGPRKKKDGDEEQEDDSPAEE